MKGSTFFISILDDQMSTRKAGEEILKVSDREDIRRRGKYDSGSRYVNVVPVIIQSKNQKNFTSLAPTTDDRDDAKHRRRRPP